jgi:DNA polymerase-3 subunit epsilon
LPPPDSLASVLGPQAETPHHALGDALTTAGAFIALATHLDASERQTVRSLRDAEEPQGRPGRFRVS